MLAKIFDLIHFFICDILGTYPILGLTNSLIYFHLINFRFADSFFMVDWINDN